MMYGTLADAAPWASRCTVEQAASMQDSLFLCAADHDNLSSIELQIGLAISVSWWYWCWLDLMPAVELPILLLMISLHHPMQACIAEKIA